jgi:LPXTG-site transpeptidase (sortase) family protein
VKGWEIVLKRKKLLLGGGGVAFVIGIGLLGFAAFSAFGGGDSPKPEVLVHLSASPSPTPVVTNTPATPTPVPAPPLGDNPYTMVIDKIGVDAPVEAFGLDANQVPEVPTGPGQAPGQIVAWYNFSAKPGTGSNAVFAGHVTWNGAAVFYNLTDLTAGDEIKLRGQDGTLLTYKISDVYDVDPNDPNSMQVMAASSTDEITIITCDGTTTNVGGTFGVEYNKRLVIRAGLQQVTPGAAVAAAGSNSGG